MLCRHVALSLLLLASAACGLKDIRPEAAIDGLSDDEVSRGQAVLNAMRTAHRAAGFCAQKTAAMIYTDEFHGLMSFAKAWPGGVDRLQLRWQTCSDNGRVTFLDGDQRLAGWGIQNWVTYKNDPDGTVAFGEDETIRFWVPTMIYFLEIPARIHEADVVAHAGQVERDGRTYDLVYATWSSPEPQKDIDQYVLWIDSQTHHLKYLHYTVRDQGEPIEGFATYGAVVDRGSYTYFDSLHVAMGDGGMDIHTAKVRSFEAGPAVVAQEVLFPDPTKTGDKYPAPASAEAAAPASQPAADDAPASQPASQPAPPDDGESSASAAEVGGEAE